MKRLVLNWVFCIVYVLLGFPIYFRFQKYFYSEHALLDKTIYYRDFIVDLGLTYSFYTMGYFLLYVLVWNAVLYQPKEDIEKEAI